MTQDQATQIISRLDAIEEMLQQVVNPMHSVTVDQKGKVLGEAIKSGDKEKIKAAQSYINGK